ncbi:MAG: patatin-like phospholipase family protein, partial [Gammaproteobacteria bacterium]
MKRLPIYFLLLQIVTIWWFPSALISAESDKYPQRMALAISGGASKGAYEAGFNWGALKILRNFAGQDPVLGGEFRPFEAASIAGASAGGINSLLSGLTWCTRSETDGGLANSINDNIFRDVWLNIDANRLLPSTATSEYYESDDALFSRNDLRIASKLLREKWHIPAFRDECQVPLGVTVTRVKPEVLYIGDVKVQNQRFYIPFELYVKQDRTAGFRFNPVDYPALTDASKLTLPTQAGLGPN